MDNIPWGVAFFTSEKESFNGKRRKDRMIRKVLKLPRAIKEIAKMTTPFDRSMNLYTISLGS
ncbi:MAG: hypothetical protein COX96_00760 [Candidatus Omnitrophica bacterium CG_4_10_14_0_2_um_filter_44_9]|nr:MAG: hypothetical protein COY78_08350 [Candidatus Omnitrophica bacterium CG_4_10_14_0_8_um_filter_44_12]PIZ85027.1 MAG: hypothetical protein COX96_00760 [Candidatus Omnitrophica bacterium CG_4_10_14_0_2_um_filter_44_9]